MPQSWPWVCAVTTVTPVVKQLMASLMVTPFFRDVFIKTQARLVRPRGLRLWEQPTHQWRYCRRESDIHRTHKNSSKPPTGSKRPAMKRKRVGPRMARCETE